MDKQKIKNNKKLEHSTFLHKEKSSANVPPSFNWMLTVVL